MIDQNTNLDPNTTDPVFNVMPAEGKNASLGGPVASQSNSVSYENTSGSSNRKWIYIIIGVIVLLALGAGAYYLLGSKEEPTPQPVSRLSKTWLTQYFNVESCTNENTCGEAADPDKDGFGNYDEFKTGTNPLNPDSDDDGLADGDEKNIYKTDPKLKYTDKREIVAQNNWTDGVQIKGGYDPLTPGVAFTDARKKQIADATVQFKLHEPTITTMGSVNTTPTPSPSPSGSLKETSNSKIYTNTKYGYELSFLKTYEFSEDTDGMRIQNYISVDDKTGLGSGEFFIEGRVEETVAKPDSTKFSNIKESTLNGFKIYEADDTSASISPMGPHVLYIISPNNNLSVRLAIYNSNSQTKPAIDQILSTFKFTK